MTAIPLRLGPLGADGFVLHRSGIRWLYEDGHICKPGEVIAYCNIGLIAKGRQGRATDPFSDEMTNFQIAFAPKIGGRLRKSRDSSRGGFLDQLYFFLHWHPDFVIGHIECQPGEESVSGTAENLRLLVLAGRKVSDITGGQHGLHTTWFQRSRGWWNDGDGLNGEMPTGTMLSLGICELSSLVRGERSAFLDFFEATRGPAQIVHIPDSLMVPSTPILIEQMRRTPAEFQAIAADFAQTFAGGALVPEPKDWFFLGTMLSALERSPLTEHYDVLTPMGLHRTGPPDAVVLTLNSEGRSILRHRRFGYTFNFHAYRLGNAGPAVHAWLKANFEPVTRTLDDILRDYCTLIDMARSTSNTQFLIMNVMSTTASEDIYSYQAFDRPMDATLRSVRGKEMNLLLHDLTRLRDIAIIDVDAITAELGAAANLLPDGVHGSGVLQAEIRAEILRNLRARRVPGFAPI